MPLRYLVFITVALSLWPQMARAQSRIISLKPNITEIVFQLSAGARLVGATTYCNHPEAAKKLSRVADYIRADAEKILKLQPDLILASKENSSQKEIQFLMERGIPVEIFSFTTLDQTKASIAKLGKVLGKNTQAKELLQQMELGLSELKKSREGQPVWKTLVVVGYDPLVVVGGQNFMDDALGYLGLKNVAQHSQIKYPTWSTEQVIRSAPELIIELPMGSENTPEKNHDRLKWWQRFSSIPAVKQQRILAFPIEEFRAVPDLPKALEKLARQIPQGQNFPTH